LRHLDSSIVRPSAGNGLSTLQFVSPAGCSSDRSSYRRGGLAWQTQRPLLGDESRPLSATG